MTNFPLDAQTLNDGGRDGTGPAYLRIKAALEKTPDDLDLLSQLIKACLLLKDDKLTEAVFKARYATRLSRKGPRAPQVRALTQLGVALHATSNSAVAIPQLSHQCLIEAQKCLDEAVNLDPENASANFNLARVKVEIGETVSALKYARKALTAASAKDASVWGLLALILTAQQKEEIAVAVIEAGLTAVLPQQQISLLRVKAKIHQLQGQRALALESLAKTQARVAEIDGENWLHIGRAFLDLGQIEDSEACLERGKLFEGQSAEVFCMQARLDKIRGKWQSARENCESALALDPRNVEAIFELGLLYNSRGVHADNLIAKGFLQDAVRLSPKHAEAWHWLGIVEKSLKQYRAAEDCLCKSIKLRHSKPCLAYYHIPPML